MNPRKGQGTIEYLVIIAIVIVLALVAAYIMFSGMGSVSATDKASVKAGWLTKEVGVGDFVVDDEGTGKLAILNNTFEFIKIKAIYVDDRANPVFSGLGTVANFEKFVTAPFTGITPCSPDKKYKLKIVYEGESGLEKTVEGYIYVDCAARMLESGLRFLQLTDLNMALDQNINISVITGYFALIDSNFVNSRSLTSYGNEGYETLNGVDLNTTRIADNNYIELDIQAE